MSASQNKLPAIRQEAFKKAREELGLSIQDLSRMSCYSVRQIEQLENGESSSFYGPQVKVTAAKKVAGLLKLSEENAFDFGDVLLSKKEGSSANKIAAIDEAKAPNDVEVGAIKKSEEVKQATPSKQKIHQSQSSNHSKRRKFYIVTGVAAALVFSIVNLRPLFFPEVVKEEVVVVEQTQAAAPADISADPKAVSPASAPASTSESAVAAVAPAVVAAPSPASAPSTECPPTDAAPVAYKPDAPKKVGDMVYLQSKTMQTVCVVDASGKIQNKTLEPGVGASVYGKPPFKVLTSGVAQVDMYYQGVKVRLSNITAKNILLEPAEFIQPLAPTDSQFR